MLRETTGLAASYFMDPAATRELTNILGQSHGVVPGTVRTFLPEADPASELDATRHRVLSSRRMAHDDGRRLRQILGRRARERAIEQPLPHAAARAFALLMERADAQLVEGVVVPERAAVPPVDIPFESSASVVVDVDAVVAEPPAAETSAVRRLDLGGPGVVILRELVGLAPSDESWSRLAELVLVGLRAESAQPDISARMADLRAQAESGLAERQALAKRLEDEQLEHASTFELLQDHERRVGSLQQLLLQTDRASEVFAPGDRTPEETAPDSFDELLGWWAEVEEVPFTGNEQTVLDLEQRDPLGVWAAKAWQAVRCLRDYVRAKSTGLATADVDHYLNNLPPEHQGWSANRHARDESSDVWNNKKFREKRRFKVPESVDPSGVTLMGAHFKIAQSGLVSPRLHYLDDTARSSRVYVGYLGPHLPTKQTN